MSGIRGRDSSGGSVRDRAALGRLPRWAHRPIRATVAGSPVGGARSSSCRPRRADGPSGPAPRGRVGQDRRAHCAGRRWSGWARRAARDRRLDRSHSNWGPIAPQGAEAAGGGCGADATTTSVSTATTSRRLGSLGSNRPPIRVSAVENGDPAPPAAPSQTSGDSRSGRAMCLADSATWCGSGWAIGRGAAGRKKMERSQPGSQRLWRVSVDGPVWAACPNAARSRTDPPDESRPRMPLTLRVC